MALRRRLTRAWRRLRRPTFGRLVSVSLVLHLVALILALRIGLPPAPLPTPPAPIVVELPPAAPGMPLSRPQAAGPPGDSRGPRPPAAPAAPRPPRRAPLAACHSGPGPDPTSGHRPRVGAAGRSAQGDAT